MGPLTILDKSAFQGLSKDEHLHFRWHFFEVITPVLVAEIAADLAKSFERRVSAEEEVAILARKFGGSGGPVNMDHRTLCIQSLLGAAIPLDGRCVPDNMTVVPLAEGGSGAFVDLSPLNRLILRLADRIPAKSDHDLAERWRAGSQTLGLRRLNQFVNEHHIVVPRINTPAEAPRVAAELLETDCLRDLWLAWALADLRIPEAPKNRVLQRWANHVGTLRSFAPYAHHCLLALLSMFVADHHNKIRWLPTNLIDLQYLYYLPFCTVFVSEDRIHRALAPALLRPDQSFVLASEFKAGLRATHERWSRLSERERHLLRWALGSYPLPMPSVVWKLWARHSPPWRPGRGNQAIQLSAQEQAEATRFVERLIDDSSQNTPDPQ